MADERENDPSVEVRRLYEEAESRTAEAFEKAVSRGAFSELLARMTENVAAVTKIGADVFDLTLRNLRLAGRQDITRLARQLNRTEDKLELLLQDVERVQEQLAEAQEATGRKASARNGQARGGQRARAKDKT